MQEVEKALQSLSDLCSAVRHYIDHEQQHERYHAPIIDHRNPDDYSQRAVAGLSRFLSHAQAEKDYVEGILQSGLPSIDFTTNAPNLLAVWDEFARAPRPVLLIAQMLEVEGHGGVKLDVVASGGNEWIKVNTIREARLMAEFREQDSYVNSDYDSDPEYEAGPDGIPTPRTASPVALSNTLIVQARALVRAAQGLRRPSGLPQPRVRFVLNRMEEQETYRDSRIPETFDIIRRMGVDLILGAQSREPEKAAIDSDPIPTKNIVLDLSVLVALCCDSTHHPLPTSPAELESRFRALRQSPTGELVLDLAEHSNVTRDLKDQLEWEVEHPLIGELVAQLERTIAHDGGDFQFWVTEEVKGRLPNIIDIIGGPNEKARARALFGDSDEDYWEHSRWKGQAKALGDVRLKILEDDDTSLPDMSSLEISGTPDFSARLVAACQHLLDPSTVTTPTSMHRQKYRRSKKYKSTDSPSPRLPSTHTLNSFIAGAKRGWTVLTNNRGAVGKVMRDMGVRDGLPYEQLREGGNKVVIWVVNPSSLSEWRRLEVEESNRVLLAARSQGAEVDKSESEAPERRPWPVGMS